MSTTLKLTNLLLIDLAWSMYAQSTYGLLWWVIFIHFSFNSDRRCCSRLSAPRVLWGVWDSGRLVPLHLDREWSKGASRGWNTRLHFFFCEEKTKIEVKWRKKTPKDTYNLIKSFPSFTESYVFMFYQMTLKKILPFCRLQFPLYKVRCLDWMISKIP